jgi:hypothetical protein
MITQLLSFQENVLKDKLNYLKLNNELLFMLIIIL